MIQIAKILYPTDFSTAADQALDQAVYLADKYRAEIHMLHAVVLHAYDPNNPEYRFPEIQDEMVDRIRLSVCDYIDRKAEAHPKSIQVKKVEARGISAAPVIVDYARDNDADIIVMGTHGRRGFRHWMLGSVAEETVRLSCCPVLTVRQQEAKPPFTGFRRVLVPVDFSKHSRNALDAAREIAKACDAQVDLLHVVEEVHVPNVYANVILNMASRREEVVRQATAELKRWVGAATGPKIECHVAEGRAVKEIADYAEAHGCDLIVISTHGLSGFEEVLIGNVANGVIRSASCPVLTLKPFGKAIFK